jgi:hypothetical protein
MDLTLSVLAIYAILSLVVERIMEMFSESWWFKRNKAKVEETKSRMADLQTRINAIAKDKDTSLDSLNPLQDERKKKQIELILLGRNRVILFLVMGTASGIAISFVFNFVFDIGLFNLFGFDITRVGDSIVSGLIIGAGTKPTHDLIGVIEKVVKK